MTNYISNKPLLLGFALFLISHSSFSQGKWEVPADKKSKVSNFKFDVQAVQAGKTLFEANCMSCHGTPGKGNNIPMVPPPPDPASKGFQANNDGELFYKMTEGRAVMPSFKNSIDEKGRWNLIAFFRSFNKSYVQPNPTGTADVKGSVSIALELNKTKDTVIVHLSNLEKGVKSAVKGFAATLWAKRYFGELKIDEEKTSDDKGTAYFACPKDLPADSANLVKLKVKVNNEAAGISVSKDTVLAIGILKKHVNVLDNRAFWNVREMAPIWLILAYSLSVLTVLGIFGYIILLIFKIWKSGKENKS